MTSHAESAEFGIHVVAKPIGPACNLNCEYCFYLEKQALFGPGEQYRMSDGVLSSATQAMRRAEQDVMVFFKSALFSGAK